MGIDTDWKLFYECYPELVDPGPPTPEDLENRCKKDLFSVIYSYGLDTTLSQLILILNETSAPLNVIEDIKKTLEDYRNRY